MKHFTTNLLNAFFIFLLAAVFIPNLVSASVPDDAEKQKILQKTASLKIPFIENKGQIDEKVKFYARTFNGTLFVDEEGVLTYSLPKEKGGVVIREHITDKALNIKGLDPSKTKISSFRGKDKSKWQKNIASFNKVSLGEVYDNIELDLIA